MVWLHLKHTIPTYSGDGVVVCEEEKKKKKKKHQGNPNNMDFIKSMMSMSILMGGRKK